MFKRFFLSAGDHVMYSNTTHWVYSNAIEHISRHTDARSPDDVAHSLERLTRAARLGYGVRNVNQLEAKIRETFAPWSPVNFDWDRFFPRSRSKSVLRSIILKRPQPNGEKGALFVAFEDEWLRLFRHARVSELARDYDLIISPSWSPPHDLSFLIAAAMWPSMLFTILSNHDDIPAFERLAQNVRVVSLLASNWVHPELFAPRVDPIKKYDIVMLANFAKYKRHFALFRALGTMDRKTKVLLLGRGWEGRTRAAIEDEARLFGALDRVTIREPLNDAEMIEGIQSAKVSVITSMREGSCVAVAESLFANVPVGLIQGANIGSRIFINDRTGCFLRTSALAKDLAAFVDRYLSYEPLKWAMENDISCKGSSLVMNEALKSWALTAGRPWTVDIVPMRWRPNAEFLVPDDKERMRDEYVRFEKSYGVSIGLQG